MVKHSSLSWHLVDSSFQNREKKKQKPKRQQTPTKKVLLQVWNLTIVGFENLRIESAGFPNYFALEAQIFHPK